MHSHLLLHSAPLSTVPSGSFEAQLDRLESLAAGLAVLEVGNLGRLRPAEGGP